MFFWYGPSGLQIKVVQRLGGRGEFGLDPTGAAGERGRKGEVEKQKTRVTKHDERSCTWPVATQEPKVRVRSLGELPCPLPESSRELTLLVVLQLVKCSGVL